MKAIIVSFFACSLALYCAEPRRWEIGIAGGYGISTNLGASSGTAGADAGFASGPALSVIAGDNMYRNIGGEFRYTLQRSDLQLKAAGQRASLEGLTQAFEYDFLFHFASRTARVRPFASVGAGGKLYQGTGREHAYQPLSEYALLTHTHEMKPLLSAGVGIKMNIGHRLQFRLDVRDHATPFPERVIVPMRSTFGGWLHDITPMAGLGLVF